VVAFLIRLSVFNLGVKVPDDFRDDPPAFDTVIQRLQELAEKL
jgi:hypothetical protein